MANFTSAHHWGDNCWAAGLYKGTLSTPLMNIIYAPPSPADFIASRSAVMPSLETAACIQYQNTQGFACSGGCWNNSRIEVSALPVNGAPEFVLACGKMNSTAKQQANMILCFFIC